MSWMRHGGVLHDVYVLAADHQCYYSEDNVVLQAHILMQRSYILLATHCFIISGNIVVICCSYLVGISKTVHQCRPAMLMRQQHQGRQERVAYPSINAISKYAPLLQMLSSSCKYHAVIAAYALLRYRSCRLPYDTITITARAVAHHASLVVAEDAVVVCCSKSPSAKVPIRTQHSTSFLLSPSSSYCKRLPDAPSGASPTPSWISGSAPIAARGSSPSS